MKESEKSASPVKKEKLNKAQEDKQAKLLESAIQEDIQWGLKDRRNN